MYERQRVPAPLLPRRMPSGRRAVEQPNAGDDGDTRLTTRVWFVLVLTGVTAGLAGAATSWFLHAVQELSDGPDRLVALAVGGAVVGVGLVVLARWCRGGSDVDDAVWTGTGELATRRSMVVATLSQVAVGVGASLGQEAAPKLLGALGGSRWATWTSLDASQRRLVVACGAGAGMGAVYDVPLGGALLTVELLLASPSLAVVLPALLCSAVATVVARLALSPGPVYAGFEDLQAGPGLLLFAVLAGPLLGGLAVGLVRGVGWVAHHRLRGRAALLGPLCAFLVLGLAAEKLPLLLGNGQVLAERAFDVDAPTPVLVLLALLLLKPLVTLLCLYGGAPGGLFTPVLSVGAVAGLLLGLAWQQLSPSTTLLGCALVGAASLSGAAMQAPLAAVVLLLELTGAGADVLLPLVVATGLATLVARYLDGYSVFSARLAHLGP